MRRCLAGTLTAVGWPRFSSGWPPRRQRRRCRGPVGAAEVAVHSRGIPSPSERGAAARQGLASARPAACHVVEQRPHPLPGRRSVAHSMGRRAEPPRWPSCRAALKRLRASWPVRRIPDQRSRFVRTGRGAYLLAGPRWRASSRPDHASLLQTAVERYALATPAFWPRGRRRHSARLPVEQLMAAARSARARRFPGATLRGRRFLLSDNSSVYSPFRAI